MKRGILYVLSLVILVTVLVLIVSSSITGDKECSRVQRAGLLKVEDGWVVQFDLINNEGKDTSYTINSSSQGKTYVSSVLILDGGVFTYLHYIDRDAVTDNEVNLAIFKEGESNPIEKATYYIQ